MRIYNTTIKYVLPPSHWQALGGLPTMSYKSVHSRLGAINAGPFLETLFLELWQENVDAVRRKVLQELNFYNQYFNM